MKGELDELGESALQAANVKKIAEELGVSQDEVIEMNERLSAHDQSLATPVGVDGDLQWQDMLESEGVAQDDAIAEASEFT